MADLEQDKDSASHLEQEEGKRQGMKHSRTFLDATSEEEVLSGIKREVEAGRLPPNVAEGMKEFYLNYRNAVIESGIPKADEVALSNANVCLDRVLLDVEEPFVFLPYHKALREPFDYYMFGQNYIRPLINFKNSYFGNIAILDEIKEKVQQGHNVILMSNHQTEADPAIIALLLESTHQSIAENMTYVAGDRVVTDPLCKPFSMGRNLICVYSKKHMYDVPELAETKKRANLQSLKEMGLLLRGGSQVIWIAPSGGRDRPDPITGECYPMPFDPSSVENMRKLVKSSGVPGHVYPLALHCYDIMPPPQQVEKEIGEKRVIGFHGVGLSIQPALNLNEILSAAANPDKSYTEVLYESVREQYQVLKCAIQGLLPVSKPSNISLSQPWNP